MRVSGDKELIAALQILSKGIPNPMIDAAMKSASQPMVEDAVAKARTHRQPGRRPKGGHLDEGIVFRKRAKQSRKRRSYVVGGVNRAIRLLHLIEFGVRPHWQPKRGVMHPGHQAWPIMRPAYEAHADSISTNFGRSIWAGIVGIIATLPKRK